MTLTAETALAVKMVILIYSLSSSHRTLGQCKCLIDESAGVCEIRDFNINSIEKITDTMYVI